MKLSIPLKVVLITIAAAVPFYLILLFNYDAAVPVVLSFCFTLMLVLIFSIRLAKSLKEISAVSDKLHYRDAKNKFTAKEYSGELGALTKSLDGLIGRIMERINWFEQIINSIPFPISVTDNNMNWTYLNRAAEQAINVKLEQVIGKSCTNWNSDICNTKNCGVQRLKEGFKGSFFNHGDMNFKVDAFYLKNNAGHEIGHVEVVQDVTQLKKIEIYLSENTNKMVGAMETFAEGNLDVSLAVEKDDDIGKLFTAFNKAVANIRSLLIKVTESVKATAGTSEEISSSTEEMAAGAQEQTSQTNEVATAVEEMAKTIIETTRNATTAAENARKAGNIATTGGKAVLDTVAGMQRISDVVLRSSETVKQLGNSSNQIGEIVQVIDDIADQTNLLALNAAIEAARAGEQGRGFAVVADEVRKLAERTTKATKEIADMIKHIQKETLEAVSSMNVGTEEVEKGKQLANHAGQALKEIISATIKVVDDITQVATASEEQSTTAEQISRSIESINNVTTETSAGIQQVARAAESLNRLTDNLQELISNFKTDGEAKSSYSVRQNGKLILS